MNEELEKFREQEKEYSKVERKDENTIVIKQEPFGDPKELKKSLWVKFADIIDGKQLENAKQLLEQDLERSFNGFGRKTSTVTLTKTRTGFTTKEKYSSPGGSSGSSSSSSRGLPLKYKKYWDESK